MRQLSIVSPEPWTTPGGGLPPAVSGGRHVIQLLCKKDKKPFVTTEP